MDFTTSQFVLNKDRVAAMSHFSPSLLQDLKLEVAQDMMYRTLVARMETFVLSEHLADDTQTATKQVPATWRDHAKQDFGYWVEKPHNRVVYAVASWIKKRLKPITFRTLELSVMWHRAATRPHSTIVAKDLGPVVYQERTDNYLRWMG